MADDDELPAWLQEKKTRWKDTKRHETRAGRMFGGRRTPASGSRPASNWGAVFARLGQIVNGERGWTVTAGCDADSGELVIEHTRTEGKGHRVTRANLAKVVAQAKRVSKIPIYMISFITGRTTSDDWILIRYSDLMELRERFGLDEGGEVL